MPTINVKGKDYLISNEQFVKIKQAAHSKVEFKEFPGFEDLAVRIGDILIGYVAGKILDEILGESQSK